MPISNKTATSARRLSSRALGVTAIGGVAALVLAGGGIAVASAKPATINACYKSGTSPATLMRVSGSACPKHYTKVTWNRQGPRGPQGPRGTQGPQGSAGRQGQPGTNGAQYGVTNTINSSVQVPTSSTQVISTPAVPVSGTYYMFATLNFALAPGDSVFCGVNGTSQEFSYGTAARGTDNSTITVTVPVAASVAASAGTPISVHCSSQLGGYIQGGTINAALVNNSTGGLS